METFFGIRYEFDRARVAELVDRKVSEGGAGYVCVADGVILSIAVRDREYLDVVNGAMFSICDSSYVPVYLKWIYGIHRESYSGSEIFRDIVSSRRYRMFFMGTSSDTLKGLRENISAWNPDVEGMKFYELPFLSVDEFDYEGIARAVNDDGADIVWVALGAPKQEIFMSRLQPFLKRGVMIAVGAAFKFNSGIDVHRAPDWMVRSHLEFVYRIFKEPRKQIKRCWGILVTLPVVLYRELKIKRRRER